MDHDALIDEAELSRRWKISVKTLRNRRVTGGFVPYLKIASTVRYRLQDVRAWENAHLRRSTSEGEANG